MADFTITTNKRQQQALKNALRAASTKPGQTLKNGATILGQKLVAEKPHGHEFRVLAVSPGFQPFVIWTRMIGTEQKSDGVNYGAIDYCFEGHYFRDLQEALDEFAKVEDQSARP